MITSSFLSIPKFTGEYFILGRAYPEWVALEAQLDNFITLVDTFASTVSGSGISPFGPAGLNSVAVPPEASATGVESTSFGFNASCGADESVAVGDTAAANIKAVAIGWHAVSSADRGIAIGHDAENSFNGGVAIGQHTRCDSESSVALGSEAATSGGVGANNIAIGFFAEAHAIGGIAIGDQAHVSIVGTGAVALGAGAVSNFASSISLGKDAVASAANEFRVGSATGAIDDMQIVGTGGTPTFRADRSPGTDEVGIETWVDLGAGPVIKTIKAAVTPPGGSVLLYVDP